MMVALLLYNYAVGVRSSRAIERRCVEDVACRVIAANRAPDHVTIARFRSRHERELSGLFLQVLGLCRKAGMVRVGTVAVDSTKLAANASMSQNRSLEGLRQEAERILEEAAQIDAREDQLYGDRRGDELPDELADPRTRRARIRELLERAQAEVDEADAERRDLLEHRAERISKGQPPPGRRPVSGLSRRQRQVRRASYNVTDPDSGIVRQHRGILIQGYNVQTAVGDGQVILATRVSGSSPDGGQLAPTVTQAEENLTRIGASDQLGEVLADTGYWDGPQIAGLKARGIRVLIPPAARKKRGPSTHPEVLEMQAAMADPANQHAYRRRQHIVEPVYAHIKHHRGITRLLRRGKQAVQAEIDLIATTHNLLKLHKTIRPAT
jgi:hypothetical protein